MEKTKICSVCKKELDICMYNKHKTGKFGVRGCCKLCQSDKKKEYKRKLKNRKNIVISVEQKKCYSCGKYLKPTMFHKNNGNISGLDDRCKKCSTSRYDPVVYKQYYNANKEKKINQVVNYHYERLKNDTNYKLACLLRSRIYKAIRGLQKSGSAVSDLGCSIEELKTYLEKQFYSNPKTGEQMTWDNWSINGWHIDHIKPLASFDLTDRKQFLEACHYSNLQPLWAEENLRKGSSNG